MKSKDKEKVTKIAFWLSSLQAALPLAMLLNIQELLRFTKRSVLANPLHIHLGFNCRHSGYGVIHKKVFHKNEDKMHKKMKMTQQKGENLVHEQHQHGVCFCKKNFAIMIYVADMAISMSNFDKFSNDQIS